MYRASVLIPTHKHAATLPFAVKTVQQQGINDIEILIVGDGVNDQLRATIKELQTGDRRIKFFDMPKGPRHGEIHRDAVLRQAQGRIVCYQCDDDLWLPGHLQAMEAALESADFVGAMQVDVELGDRLRGYLFDLERPEFWSHGWSGSLTALAIGPTTGSDWHLRRTGSRLIAAYPKAGQQRLPALFLPINTCGINSFGSLGAG